MHYIAIAILGATAMPHDLCLLSSIVRTRMYRETAPGKAASSPSRASHRIGIDLDGDAGRADRHGTVLDIRLRPWLRRLITRMIAIIPAAIVAIRYGESGTAHLLISVR
jgi:Mn2+/Fe2+ NRAMP family transporter